MVELPKNLLEHLSIDSSNINWYYLKNLNFWKMDFELFSLWCSFSEKSKIRIYFGSTQVLDWSGKANSEDELKLQALDILFETLAILNGRILEIMWWRK
jgi:hypothetical protein